MANGSGHVTFTPAMAGGMGSWDDRAAWKPVVETVLARVAWDPRAAETDAATLRLAAHLHEPPAAAALQLGIARRSSNRPTLPTPLIARAAELLASGVPRSAIHRHVLFCALACGDPEAHAALVAPVLTFALDPDGPLATAAIRDAQRVRTEAMRAAARYPSLGGVLLPLLVAYRTGRPWGAASIHDMEQEVQAFTALLPAATPADRARVAAILTPMLTDAVTSVALFAARCTPCYADPAFFAAAARRARTSGGVAGLVAPHLPVETLTAFLPGWVQGLAASGLRTPDDAGLLAAVTVAATHPDVTIPVEAVLPLLGSGQPAAVRAAGVLLAGRATPTSPPSQTTAAALETSAAPGSSELPERRSTLA